MKRLAGPRLWALANRVGVVAVAGQDEQVGAVGGGHDFAFGAPVALAAGRGAAQSCGGGGQQLFGGGGGHVLQRGAGVAFGVAATEQPGVGAVGGFGDLGAGDAQQHNVGVGGRIHDGAETCHPPLADATLPQFRWRAPPPQVLMHFTAKRRHPSAEGERLVLHGVNVTPIA